MQVRGEGVDATNTRSSNAVMASQHAATANAFL
jgi:hypothetical protein